MKTTAEERAAMRFALKEIRARQEAEQKALKELRLTPAELDGMVKDAPRRRETWARMGTVSQVVEPRAEAAE